MILNKKLLRDLYLKIGSNIAVVVLIVIGIAIFASFGFLKVDLQKSVDVFYEDGAFADGFIELRGIPFQKLAYLSKIDGVKEIQGKIETEFKVDFYGAEDEVRLKIMSYEKNSDKLNKYILSEGEHPRAGSRQILLDKKFADENHLKIGDKITIKSGKNSAKFTVCGTGFNPETGYLLKNPSDLFPDYKTYGAGEIDLKSMENLSGINGKYNNVVFTLESGADFSKVRDDLDKQLRNFGVSSIYEKKNQFSNMMITNEIDQSKAMSVLLPTVFLTIASMIEYIMIDRLVKSQRGQIGILKAFGYDNTKILLYYVKYALILGITGSIIGTAVSLPILDRLLEMYKDYFSFPEFYFEIDPVYFIAAFIIGIGFSAAAGISGAYSIIKLKPIEALKPEEIKYSQKKNFADRFFFMFDTIGKMSLRNISRNVRRSLFIFAGIMLTFALTSLTFIVTYLTDDMIYDRYNYSEKYDAKIIFKYPADEKMALDEIKSRYKVAVAEGIFETPVSVYSKNIKKETTLTGTDNNLYSITDKNNRKIPLGDTDFKISKRLSEILGVKIGDSLYIKTPYDDAKDKLKVTVTGIVKQNVGMGAYMSKRGLNKLIGTDNAATALVLKSDRETIKQMADDYELASNVTAVNDVVNVIENVKKSRELFSYLTYVFAFLGVVMGFIVVYNSYIVSINERQRELSSMLVLGFSKKQVSEVVSLEQWGISFAAMAAGVPVSKFILVMLSLAASTDMWTLPTDLKPIGFVIGFFASVTSVVIAQKMGYKKIESFSIVEVLKERD